MKLALAALAFGAGVVVVTLVVTIKLPPDAADRWYAAGFAGSGVGALALLYSYSRHRRDRNLP